MPQPAKLQFKYNKKDKVKFNQVSMNDGKNCQETKFIHMWPLKPEKQVLCSYLNQQYHTSTQDCVMTRGVNLQDVSRENIQ